MATRTRRVARQRRQARVRRRVRGTDARPRLCVFRSNKHIYAQVISDDSGRTLAAASTVDARGRAATGNKRRGAQGRRAHRAALPGARASRTVVFDRNGFLYHGRVKEVADGARAAGLKF